MDRLSLLKADAGFHIGTGTALLIAAFIPGDGSLRGLEAFVGVAMFCVGSWKSRQCQDQVWHIMGVGLANVIGRLTTQQIQIAAAIINSLRVDSAKGDPSEGATGSGTVQAESSESATD